MRVCSLYEGSIHAISSLALGGGHVPKQLEKDRDGEYQQWYALHKTPEESFLAKAGPLCSSYLWGKLESQIHTGKL